MYFVDIAIQHCPNRGAGEHKIIAVPSGLLHQRSRRKTPAQSRVRSTAVEFPLASPDIGSKSWSPQPDSAMIHVTITSAAWLPIVLIVLASTAPFDACAAEAQTVKAAAQQVLRVGPDHQYTRPSQAAQVARDGALVEIHSGQHGADVAVWRQNDLTLRGVGERPHLRARGRAAEGKAIWVIKGDRVNVENVEMSGAWGPSRNGAAIRAEETDLTTRNCRFHHNQMGLLTNPSPDSVVTIEDSEIHHNTTDTAAHGRAGHNIDVHRARLFILRNSHMHGARTGHQVKTRAQRNEIRDNEIEDGDRWGSLLLDISDGGQAEAVDNRLQKGALAGNRTAIGFAGEAVDRSAPDYALRVDRTPHREPRQPRGAFNPLAMRDWGVPCVHRA